jgi:hypothetical protein
MQALRGLGFPDVYQMHVAQDALDDILEMERDKAKRKIKGLR